MPPSMTMMMRSPERCQVMKAGLTNSDCVGEEKAREPAIIPEIA